MTINNYLTKLVKKRKLLGRSEKKTSGRGQKGQGSRKSANVRQGFEGGQTPVYRRFRTFSHKARNAVPDRNGHWRTPPWPYSRHPASHA